MHTQDKCDFYIFIEFLEFSILNKQTSKQTQTQWFGNTTKSCQSAPHTLATGMPYLHQYVCVPHHLDYDSPVSQIGYCFINHCKQNYNFFPLT